MTHPVPTEGRAHLSEDAHDLAEFPGWLCAVCGYGGEEDYLCTRRDCPYFDPPEGAAGT